MQKRNEWDIPTLNLSKEDRVEKLSRKHRKNSDDYDGGTRLEQDPSRQAQGHNASCHEQEVDDLLNEEEVSKHVVNERQPILIDGHVRGVSLRDLPGNDVHGIRVITV